MAPINLPDGSQVSEIVLPDGSTASEVLAPDGSRVFGGTPDSGVAQYQFEQDVTDSFNNNDGTDNTGAGYTTDAEIDSNAKVFNGSGAVDLPSLGVAFDGSQSFSISAFFKSSNNQDQCVFSFDGGSSFRVDSGNGNVPYFEFNNSDVLIGSTAVTGGTYKMLTLTYDESTDDVTIYVDDSQDGATTKSSFTTGTIDEKIGERSDGLFSADGKIDHLAVYDKELSSTEVSNRLSTGSID